MTTIAKPLQAQLAEHFVIGRPEATTVQTSIDETRKWLFRFRDGLPAKHVAIASGPDRMIHAHDRASVAEVAIIPFWRRRIVCAFRFPGVAGD